MLKDHINLDRISELLQGRQKVNASVFVFVAVYVTFGNSMVEEVFFRGILVDAIIKHPQVFASALFAFYHLVIFLGWFSWWVTAIALLGLFLSGLPFTWLNYPKRSIWNSRAMHILADVSIMIIGFQMYGMLEAV